MSKWEMVRLGDVCDVRDGTHDSPKYCEKGYPLVTSKNIVDGQLDLVNVNYISKQDFDAINNRSKVDIGDIIMPMIGTIGNPLIIDKQNEFAIKNVALIKFINENVLNTYIYYILISHIFFKYVKKENRGGTQKFLSLKNIREFNIPLPPLTIQQKIARTLDTAAALLALRKRQLAELDALIQSVFIEMFGDPVVNEKGWEICKFNKFIMFITSGSRGWAKYFSEKGELFITIKNVRSGRLHLNNVQKIMPPNNKEATRTKLQENDLLISITADLGRTAVIDKEIAEKGAYINQHLCLVRLDLDKIVPIYLSVFLESSGGQCQFQKKDQVGVKSGLNFEAIKSIKILLPPIQLQIQFAAIVEKIEQQKSQVQQAIDETQTLFDSLMSRYFD